MYLFQHDWSYDVSPLSTDLDYPTSYYELLPTMSFGSAALVTGHIDVLYSQSLALSSDA